VFRNDTSSTNDCTTTTTTTTSTSTSTTASTAITKIRLNKVFTARYSRRHADQLIRDRRVTVNGCIVHQMGVRVQPYHDIIALDGIVYPHWEQYLHFKEKLLPSLSSLSSSSSSSSSTKKSSKTSTTTNDRSSPSLSTIPQVNHHDNNQDNSNSNSNHRNHHQNSNIRQQPRHTTTTTTIRPTMLKNNDVVETQQQQQQQHLLDHHHQEEEYIKFWKPVGVTSTTDPLISGNLIAALEYYSFHHTNHHHHRQQQQQQQPPIQRRIFSIGRLDKDTSGLLLLTSDGRIPNAVLQKQKKCPKTYIVELDRRVHDRDIQHLCQGIVITTDTIRGGKHVPYTAPTLPCTIIPLLQQNQSNHHHHHHRNYSSHIVQITLMEGRNRQIRIMFQTLGYKVVKLHRSDFMGITLDNLHAPGEWTRLSTEEIQQLLRAVG
jgi:pseudouridine synthase